MKESKVKNDMNKTFIMAKLKADEKEIQKLINKGFEDPYDYLKVNSNLIIGRLISGPRLDENKNIVSHSIIGNISDFDNAKRNNKSVGLKNFLNKTLANLNPIFNSIKKEKKKPYEYIDDVKLKEIYHDIEKKSIKKNGEKNSNDDLNDIPFNVKKVLNFQESCLHSRTKSLDFNKNISKYLARKTKKTEEELLLNKIDYHRAKKEFEEIILNKSITSFENNIPISDWMMNLRHSKNNNIPSTSYVYYGDVYNPYWIPVREKKKKSIDILRNPLLKTKTDFKGYQKNKNMIENQFNESSNNFNNINSFSFLNTNGDTKNFSCTKSMSNFSNNLLKKDMMVKGKSLIDSEKIVSNQIIGKKIIYRKDYLDNHIYGTFQSLNAVENERNLSNLRNSININSSYSSPFYNKGSPVKIKLIK